MNRVHSQIALDVYSRLFLESGTDTVYWDDFFGVTILEPALVATFGALDLANDHHFATTAAVFKQALDRFEKLDLSESTAYTANNILLILNAFFKSLNDVAKQQRKHRFHQTVAQELETEILTPSQVIVRVCLDQKVGLDDVLDSFQKKAFARLYQAIKTALDSPYLMKSALRLVTNVVLVLAGSPIMDMLYSTDLNVQFYQKVILREFEDKGTMESDSSLLMIDYNRHFIVLSVLVNDRDHRDDNVYKTYLSTKVDDPKIFATINEYLYPIISFNLVLLDDLRPDLAIQRSHGSSFFNILTFNKFNKMNYAYRELLLDVFDSDLKMLLKLKQAAISEDPKRARTSIESLSLNLVIYSLVVNSTAYTRYLTGHYNENDGIPEENTVNNLFDLFLSYSSFIFQNQHENHVNHIISRLNLLVYFKILSLDDHDVISNLLSTTIDQFRFKLCHQTVPYLNNYISYQDLSSSGSDEQYYDEEDLDNNQYKVKMLFLLDVLQCFLRFNMTSNLDLISMKLALANIFWIVDCLAQNYSMALSEQSEDQDPLEFLFEYNWNDLFITLFGLLKFLNNERVVSKKKSSPKYYSLIEEIFILVTILLVNGDKLFKYDNYLVELIYKLSEYTEAIIASCKTLKDNGQELSIYARIVLCVVYFMNRKFNFKSVLQELESLADFSHLNLSDQVLDFSTSHDLSYNQIAEILRTFVEDIPTTVKSNSLLKELTEENDLYLRLDEKSVGLMIKKAQFKEESLKYLEKKKTLFNNYKISLVGEGISVMVDQFERMFK